MLWEGLGRLKSHLRLTSCDLDDELTWSGAKCEPSFEAIDTYDDHRMAMAFAPFAIKFPHLHIRNPQVVSKSYPGFWNDLKTAWFNINE